MEKPKPLPLSLREKDRYLVFEVIASADFSYDDLVKSVWFTLLSFLGELGASRCEIRFIRNLYDAKRKRGVIRCAHNRIEEVRASLSLVKRIGNACAIIRVLGVTGTIKSARKKFLGLSLIHI